VFLLGAPFRAQVCERMYPVSFQGFVWVPQLLPILISLVSFVPQPIDVRKTSFFFSPLLFSSTRSSTSSFFDCLLVLKFM